MKQLYQRTTTVKTHQLKNEIRHLEKLKDDLQVLLDKLKEQHHDMETTKLRLWAKLIQSGHHDSYRCEFLINIVPVL